MAVYFITGDLGSGKSLAAVGRIAEYIGQGRRIATNVDLYPEHFRNKMNRRVDITRLPDKPKIEHLQAIGRGYEGDRVQEDRYGLLVLDECGDWFNSRNWSDKDRAPVNSWFRHARKYRWDIIFLVQDLSLIDSQARESIAEHVGFCKRLDRIRIPFVSPFFKLFGLKVTLPKIHRCRIFYGKSKTDLIADVWTYTRHMYQHHYDTEQAFAESDDGNYCLLTPWHLVGRYRKRITLMGLANAYVMPVIRYGIAYPLYYAEQALRSLSADRQRSVAR